MSERSQGRGSWALSTALPIPSWARRLPDTNIAGQLSSEPLSSAAEKWRCGWRAAPWLCWSSAAEEVVHGLETSALRAEAVLGGREGKGAYSEEGLCTGGDDAEFYDFSLPSYLVFCSAPSLMIYLLPGNFPPERCFTLPCLFHYSTHRPHPNPCALTLALQKPACLQGTAWVCVPVCRWKMKGQAKPGRSRKGDAGAVHRQRNG